MTADHVLLVSNDAHFGPPLDVYRQYCPSTLLGDFEAYVDALRADGEQAISPGSEQRTYENSGRLFRKVFASVEPAGTGYAEYNLKLLEHEPDQHHAPTILANMDADGLAASVFFHGGQNGQPIPFAATVGLVSGRPYYADRHGAELALEGMRMYNRWLADTCAEDPERLIGLAMIPMWDIELAIHEVARARELGLRALNFPAPRPTIPDYGLPCWEPFWSAVADHDMPLNTHGASSPVVMDLASYTGVNGWHTMMFELIQFSRRGLHFMIFGGVFERHPTLKYILTEQPSTWVEDTLHDMDSIAATQWGGVKWTLPELPSAYFMRNCYVGNSFMSNAEAHDAVRQGTTDRVLWGADYPHTEGTWPNTVLSVRKAAAGLSDEDLRKMFGLNTVGVYGLDRARLEAVAEHIGPTMDQLRTPLAPEELPREARLTMAFRDGTSW
jgi:predicted TIM-barrel fold metal-dependent hydrolase